MTLSLNVERYCRHVERFDMSDAQKTELLRAVWAIMENFVDRAFGVDAVQLSGAPDIVKRAGGRAAMVLSETTVTTSNSLQGAFQVSAGIGRDRKR